MAIKLQNGFELLDANKALLLVCPHPDILLPNGESLLATYTDENGLYTPPESEVIDSCTLCGIPVHKRGDLLTSSEVKVLNVWARENMVSGWIDLNNLEVVKAVLRLVEVDPTQSPALVKLGDKSYRSLSNATNRLLSMARLGSDTKPGYVFDAIQGRWVVADEMIVDALAMLASAQHRLVMVCVAKAIKPEIELPMVRITGNLPPQFVDFIDRGKSRTPKDREFRDTSNFSETLLSECMAELPAPPDLPKVKNKLSGFLVTVSNNVYARLNGANVHPAKGQSPSEGHRVRLQQLFGDGSDIQRVIVKVYEASLDENGKTRPWVSAAKNPGWGVPEIATAILLHEAAKVEEFGNLIQSIDTGDREPIAVDYDWVDAFLAALSDSCGEPQTGVFGPALADYRKASNEITNAGGQKPNAQETFGCIVRAIGQYDRDGNTSKVWLGKRDRKKAEKSKAWVTFGGADRGPIEKD